MAKDIITLTDSAASYIASKAGGKLRVSLRKGGCSGQEYVFSEAQAPQEGDETLRLKGVDVYVDRSAVLYVIGSEMDYAEDDFSAKILFRNPNEKGACGCGKSVSFS